MIAKFYTFIFFIFILNINFAQEIDINKTTSTNPLPTFFTGTGIGSITSGLNFEVSNNTITNTYLSSEYIKLCKKLKTSDYRFPAGTSGNYYHFYGKGNGYDTSEIFCNETYYGIPNASKFTEVYNSYLFDNRLEKNYAYNFVDFMKEMKKEIKDAGFYYHLNSHTHIYQGELKNITNDLQLLFNKYFNNNQTLLNTKFDEVINAVDTNQIKLAIDAMHKLKKDTAILRIKNNLQNDPKFHYHFQENINSVRYFTSENVGLKGIEIGNETQAEYMFFDDDFTYHRFQCGVPAPDSANPFTKIKFRDYLEGLMKNWIIVTLYADTIHQLFNLPIGLTVSGFSASVGFNSNLEPFLINPFNSGEKKAFFWSKFFALEDKIDALIPHIYTQKLIECDKYEEIMAITSAETINETILKYINFYNNIALPYHLEHIQKTVLNKPLWITEWNYNMGSIVSNTFLHTYYLNNAISKNIEHYENNKYNIQTWLLHYLSAGYYAFALIKAGYNRSGQYSIDKLLPYESFYMWNETLQNNSKKIIYEIESKIKKEKNNNIFINNKKDEIYIHFENLSNENDYYNFSNLTFRNLDSLYSIDKIYTYTLKAKTFLASNFTDCDAIKNQIPDSSYEISNDSTNKFDSILLPPKSIGRITLKLSKKISTQINTSTPKKKCAFRKIFSKSSK